MNWFARYSRPLSDAARQAASRRQPLSSGRRGTLDAPQPGEVIGEIGVVLVVYLSIALSIAFALRAFGIA